MVKKSAKADAQGDDATPREAGQAENVGRDADFRNRVSG